MAIKNIDMVFVLDVTGSMGFFVDRFRRNLLPMLRQRLSERAETAKIKKLLAENAACAAKAGYLGRLEAIAEELGL